MALYRKYRPATFAEVVGQEHVTEPLSTALDTGRISHAYLFSGPRGCGKTSSARILARSLNCVEGPTSRPCGVCPSCVALAPGGAGNLDVIELDAASHGGVDDTRELRDRAFYAPAESRYRVFIVDEAHMVTTAGFNALLKIVEEPPAHLIFVFATTEPDKVLPTIRSRTHHYPFRLLPPATMRGLLGTICEQERVPVEEAVYPLVIRAGGGSPRDSLSVLDQLLAGAGDEGVTYPRALALLGVTDIALIDDAIEALAADDGAALFGTVDSVVEAGHDPRRFAGDLLERMRDLILLRAVPDAAERNLVTGPGDVLERMRDQAQRLGQAALTRYAELLHEGLGEMRGATAPRLLLEVVCARMLLPVASDSESATLQRLERLERQMAGGVVAPAPSADRAPARAAAEGERPSGRAAADTAQSGPPRRRGAEALAAMRENRAGGSTGPDSRASDTAPPDRQSSRQRPHPAQRAQQSAPESTGGQPDSDIAPNPSRESAQSRPPGQAPADRPVDEQSPGDHPQRAAGAGGQSAQGRAGSGAAGRATVADAASRQDAPPSAAPEEGGAQGGSGSGAAERGRVAEAASRSGMPANTSSGGSAAPAPEEGESGPAEHATGDSAVSRQGVPSNASSGGSAAREESESSPAEHAAGGSAVSRQGVSSNASSRGSAAQGEGESGPAEHAAGGSAVFGQGVSSNASSEEGAGRGDAGAGAAGPATGDAAASRAAHGVTSSGSADEGIAGDGDRTMDQTVSDGDSHAVAGERAGEGMPGALDDPDAEASSDDSVQAGGRAAEGAARSARGEFAPDVPMDVEPAAPQDDPIDRGAPDPAGFAFASGVSRTESHASQDDSSSAVPESNADSPERSAPSDAPRSADAQRSRTADEPLTPSSADAGSPGTDDPAAESRADGTSGAPAADRASQAVDSEPAPSAPSGSADQDAVSSPDETPGDSPASAPEAVDAASRSRRNPPGPADSADGPLEGQSTPVQAGDESDSGAMDSGHPTQEAPAPDDVDSGAAESSAAAAGSGDDVLREVEAAWGDIRAKVREFGAAVHALLSGASVARFEGETVVLAHQHAPLAQRLANPKYVEAVESAIEAVLGRRYGVRWEVAGASSGGARPEPPARPQPAQGRGGPARSAEPQRYTRPSQARGTAPESGAAPREQRPTNRDSGGRPGGPVTRTTHSGDASMPPDDDIPLPDGPDLPDDPGPDDYSSVGYDRVPPASTPEEEREMLAESARPVPQRDRRDPDEVALELLSAELGATRMEA